MYAAANPAVVRTPGEGFLCNGPHQSFRDEMFRNGEDFPPIHRRFFMFTLSTGKGRAILRTLKNMVDLHFFRREGPFTLARIATEVGGVLSHGNGQADIADIATPQAATADTICVYCDPRFRDACRDSKAGIFVTNAKLAAHLEGKPLLIVADPRLAFAQLAHLFYPLAAVVPYVDPKAAVADSAKLGEGTRIEAGAVVGENVVLGPRALIGRGAVIEDGVEIGADVRIGANVCISHAKIGARTIIAAGTTVGGAGFGFVPSPTGILRVPQLGRVQIGTDVEIGNNCTIDRGAMDDTVIGDGSKIDNLVHLAHNVRIGKYCIITAQVGVAGSTVIGDGTMIGGQVAIADHIRVGARVKIVPQSGIMRDIPDGETVGGSPAMPVREWHRQTVALAKLAGVKPGGKH